MGDIMRQVPLKELIKRIFQEYGSQKTIFALPESSFFRKTGDKKVAIAGEFSETPLGPAAGPHTQLAQNIITSYLAGSRFIELKTVQEKEPLVAKPCIDAQDEGFNTEWSSEFTVEKAFEEYIKAWVILHLLEEVFELRTGKERSFIFNMSVGYNLEGIQSPRMDYYINSLMNASGHPFFIRCLTDLEELLAEKSFLKGTGLEGRMTALRGLPERISPKVCSTATLSTMHGCPPAEIEKICAYMLVDKKLATYVKLNPTLLSFPKVRHILDKLGFHYVELAPETFEHDLQYEDAIPMLHRLQNLAADHGRFFGVKLTNTLGSVNFKEKLPGSEMYMSGRALFPLSINLAAKICREFNGSLPISFSAGISEHNVADVFATGIRPITMATELLKPGGYNRMAAVAAKLEGLEGWDKEKINVALVEELAAKVLNIDYAHKYYRGSDQAAIAGRLPLVDCYEAPCKMACPIHQDIPEYIRLVGEKRYREALALIYEKNALPSITGHICNHACQYHCTRLDYEGCVLIREVKRIAVKMGIDEYRKQWKAPASNGVQIAVMGAGPAGLAAAYFLAREGFDVTVFDPHATAGGTVRYVIPRFRISDAAIDSDVDFIKDQGVKFVFNADPVLTPEVLQKQQGFRYVLVAVGAGVEKPFVLKNKNTGNIVSAIAFLEEYNHNSQALNLGRTVAVVGAGNTAMDAARTARKIAGVEKVYVLYRRTAKEMPAYREEYEMALADGVSFRFLRNPENFTADGKLICRVMRLGTLDASGRCQPEATDDVDTLEVDTLITSIGEDIDRNLLQQLGIGTPTKVDRKTNATAGNKQVYLIGDAHTGPSSIVNSIAEARRAADAICREENGNWQRQSYVPGQATDKQMKDIAAKKIGLTWQAKVPAECSTQVDLSVAERESHRCLECNYICNKCVEVCPNRANITVEVPGDFMNRYQIVHLDAYCNECGNCATFCPWEGHPYTDKTTIFSLRYDFENSKNNGFLLDGDKVRVRCEGKVCIFDLQNGYLTADGASDTMHKMVRIFNTLYVKRPSLFGPVEEEGGKLC